MNSAQRLRVRDLFEQVLGQAENIRHKWLAEAAGDDPVVLAEVEALLAHDRAAGAFLEESVVPRVAHLFLEDSRLEPGASLGPYQIVREIGRGGMGRVYLATDVRLGRSVALKALSPLLTRDPVQRERLRREARAAAALNHPGICTIYALEELDGDAFITSEFIDGCSLRAEIEAGPPPPADQLMRTARELAAALACAHQAGITHRDLKPENVMRGRDGRVRILDFGLAIVAPGSGADPRLLPRVTQPGALVGTPAYMAPEQLNADPVDARTDVFLLGLLLYEYATGVHPFDAATPLALAGRLLEGTPRPLQEIRPDVSSLATVIERCLQKAPSDRYPSAVELSADLEDETANVRRPAGAAAAWWRRHQIVAIGLSLMASVVAWQIKEWVGGFTRPVFVVVGIAATVVGVFRGHLLFTEQNNRPSFVGELVRSRVVTLAGDVLVAMLVGLDGLAIANIRPVAGLLAIALAVGIALARLVVERATTRAAFQID